ncbi:MAG: alpha/beta hydrolase [Rhodospirillaceae bacterium]|nr:alpha/beta hydrolase [Rhodospirillaceae bacterium]
MDIQIVDNVPFGHGDLKADLYLPQDDGQSPRVAVVLVFGGGWSTGDKTQQKAYGIKLSKAGIVCVATDYRWSSQAIWPAQLDDVSAAVQWLRASAATYNVDPNRIGISGNSSGGHLALMTGLTREKVAAICAFYPPTDLEDLYHKGGNDTLDPLMGGDATPEKLRAASPLSHIQGCSAPVLLLSGDADARVPVAQTYALHQKLTAHGTKVELHIFTGLGHAFDFDRGMTLLSADLLIRFFTSQMK